MRIWLVTLAEPLPTDNVRPMRFMGLADRLLARGHEVTIWASSFFHAAGRQRFEEDTFREFRPGCRIAVLRSLGYERNVSFRRLAAHAHFARRLAATMPSHPAPDVIVATLPSLDLAEACVRFGRRRGIPVVVDVIDPWPEVFEHAAPRWMRPPIRLLLAPMYLQARRLLSRSSAVTAISATYRDWAVRLAGRANMPSAVFFPAADLASYDRAASGPARTVPGPGGPPMRFAYAGALTRQYDVETIVRCARRLHRDGFTGAEFVIAGAGAKLESLRKMAEGLPNVGLPGLLGADALANLLASSHAGIACYAAGATQSVTYKLFDYLGAGLPILTSLPGEMARIVQSERVGCYYPPQNEAALAELVMKLCGDPAGTLEMGRRGRAFAERVGDTRRVYDDMAAFVERIAGIRR